MSKVQTPAGDYENIKKAINQITRCINTLPDNQEKVAVKIKNLRKFHVGFEKRMESANLQDDEFQELIDQGSVLIDRIQTILPLMDKYDNKSINFQKFSQLLRTKNNKQSSPNPPKIQEQTNIQSQKLSQQKISQSTMKKQAPKAEPHKNQPIKSSVPKEESRIHEQAHVSNKSINQQRSSLKEVPKDSKINPAQYQQVESPVKKQGSYANFSEPRSTSSLPHDSKQSVTKELQSLAQKSHSKEQQVSYLPVSHKNYERDSQDVDADLKKFLFKESPEKSNTNTQKKEKDQLTRKSIPQNHIQHKQSNPPSMKTLNHIQQIKSKPKLPQRIQQKASNRNIEHKNPLDKKIQSSEKILSDKFKNQFKDFKQYQNISPLQVQEQNNIHIKIPKNLNNVNGSYKFKHTDSVQQQKLVNNSRASNKSDNIKFQESKISQKDNLDADQDDVIVMPDDDPLELSFHQIKEEDFKNTKDLSFKKCFEAEKYLLGQNKNTKMFWLQNTTTSLIKSSTNSKIRGHSRNKDSSLNIVPQILNEKNKKHQDELKYIEEQQNRKIRELQGKIKKLQNQGKTLQSKVVEQDRQIKSFKAQSQIDYSRTKKNSYIEDQDLMFKSKFNAQKQAKDRSVFEQSRKQPKYLDPQGKLISIKKYNQYFAKLKDQKMKKNQLKSKELVHKDDLIEIGSMTKRENKNLNVTFYITPEEDLQSLTIKLQPILNNNLQIQIEPKNIGLIRRKKQEKINIIINVINVPYQLPELQFVYNINNKMYSHRCIIPCSFHKFVNIEPYQEKLLISKFQGEFHVIRGEEVPYSKKILKNPSLLAEFFSNGVILRRGEHNENGEIQFGGSASWGREAFYLRILVKPNQFLYVQGSSGSQSQAVEYYVGVVTNLLMKNVNFSQIH